MLARKLGCPSCSAKLRVADTLPAGKVIKCPKCGHNFPAPATDDNSPAPQVRVVRPRKPAPLPEPDEDRDEPVKKRPMVRKRRKKRKKAAKNTSLVLGLVIGGAVLLIGAALTFAMVFRFSKKPNTAIAENNPSRPSPPVSVDASNPSRSGPTGPLAGAGAGTSGPGQDIAVAQPIAAGRTVFEQHNCGRCHRISSGSGPAGGGPARGPGKGPDLGTVGRDPSHTIEWLMEQIRNPRAHRPDGRMPPYEGKIKDEDLDALAEYLASLK